MARKLAEPPSAPPPAPAPGTAAAARAALLARGALHTAGVEAHRSDPLADAVAARAVAAAVGRHRAELERRGLSEAQVEAALALAGEIEAHLAAVPATSLAARGVSSEAAELIAEAAAAAHAARDAVARVARGPRGSKTARAFGLGEACDARRPSHLLRALRRIAEGARAYPEAAADAGLLEEDLSGLGELARDLAALPGARPGADGESSALRAAQAGLRAFFDLVAAKGTLALSGDPDERDRLLSLLPRAEDRRRGQRGAVRARG